MGAAIFGGWQGKKRGRRIASAGLFNEVQDKIGCL